MHSLYIKHLIVLVVCFAGYTATSGENQALPNGTIIWRKQEAKKFDSSLRTTYDDEGLGPWYSLANSFIGTVLNKDPWGIAGKFLNKENVDIKDDIILGYGIGMIVTVAIGILFCFLMPIVGFCFCCCRCCGNCGGEMTQKDSPRNGCKRAVFGVILCMITLLMFAGVLLTFVCNDNMSKTLDKAKETSTGIVEETSKFINQTIGEFDSLLGTDLDFVIDQLKKDITDDQLRKLVGDPFLKELDATVMKPIEAVSQLSEDTKKMEEQLNIIVNNTDDLKSKANELATGLNEAKNNISSMITKCNSIPSAGSFCGGINANDLQQGADFNKVPNVTNQLQKVREVTEKDFTGTAEKGLQTLKDVPETIISKTNDSRQEIGKLISNATQKGNDILKDVRSQSDEVVLDPLKKVKDDVHEYVDYGKTYDKYRWYAGVGLTCLLLLIVVLMALGLMCGICGHDKHATPSSRGTVSNMGGNCLMAATGFCFIFASFLMLLTTICFIIGAPMQGIVCEPLVSGKIFSEFLDNKKYFDPLPLSSLLKNNKTEIKIGDVLTNCRNNEPAYTALKLEDIFNISKMLNIKELMGKQVDQQFEDLKINLTDQTILNNETKQSLNDLSSTGVDEINFEQFTNETRKGITTTNLTEYADKLDAFANNMTILANKSIPAGDKTKATEIATQAKDIANDLRELDKNTVQGMSAKADELDKNVVDLKSLGNDLSNHSVNVLKQAEMAEKSLHESSDKINKVIVDYKDRVLGWGYQLTDHILNLVNNELGRCKPLTNVFDAVVVLACKDFLYPFNGFWCAIGFCLFFFIPAIIFSVKLAKHYRRMKYESEFDDYGGQNMIEMGQPVGQEKKLWANPNYSNGTQH